MGRKSSSKQQLRTAEPPSTPGVPPPPGASNGRRALVLALAVVAVALGIIVYSRSSGSEPARGPEVPASTAAQQTPVEPTWAKFGPHPQADLPPLPFDPMPPPRPIEVVRAAYKFAAEHPEVLGYVPCYCGCERSGHRGNDDCFVTRRAPNGDVTDWEPHGMT
jgi:hypothetical protein